MRVTAEELPERQVKLQIEIDDDRHAEAIEQAYRRLAPRVQIRGFRPGRAPRSLIEKQLGRHRLLDEAMDILIPIAYREAVEEQSLIPVAQPAVELVSHEPLVFTATVPLQPVIELGDYHSLRLPRAEVGVKDEEVGKSIDELRRRYGTVEPVERAAQRGDVIRADIRAEAGGGVLFEQDEVEFHLQDENLTSLPGLGDALAGMRKGEEKTVEAPVAEDFDNPRLAGRTAVYRIVMKDVKEEKPAALDDAFAKEVGEGFENVAALQQRVREDLQKAADDAALREYETQVVEALVERASIEYPSVLLEHEVEHILDDQANLDPRDPRAQELYLERLGKSEEEVKESVREDAARRLRRSLVLSTFAEAENIEVTDADVDAELQTLTASAGEQAQTIMTLFDNENGRDTLRRSLLTRETLARLVEVASGGAAAEEAAAPQPKRRRSAPRRSG